MVAPSSIETLVENYEFFINEFNILSPDYTLVRDDI